VPDTPDAPDVVAALQEANARLREQNAELHAENAELKAQLAEQAGKIARLERLISRNSGNSSMPPGRGPHRGRSRRGAGRTGAGAAGRASSPARRVRTWRGTIIRTRGFRISRRAPARAALTWPGPRT
jgi:hypothetical protein